MNHVHYRLISTSSRSRFDRECNEIAKVGYVPVFPVTVTTYKIGLHTEKLFTQQWKYEKERTDQK